MRTEELIRALVADGSRPVLPIGQALWRALGLGSVLSAVLFLFTLRPRPDLEQALHTLPFTFKLTFALSVAGTAAVCLAQTARPFPPDRRRWLVALAPLLLAAAVLIELITVPADAWVKHLVGHNAARCVSFIPLLSLPVLVCLFATLRRSAPMRPALAGAIAGLVSAGVGALLYALACREDSPLFIATWYSIAIAIVTGAAARVGRRVLRW